MVLPAPVLPMADVALMDEAAQALGGDLSQLMERSGELIAREAQRLAPTGAILVACGPGNNGGDGYVCARHLALAGRVVRLWPVLPARSPLCELQAKRLPGGVVLVQDCSGEKPALVVDAILGAGTRGRPRDPVASALSQLKSLGAPVLAADVPSGFGTDLVLPAVMTVCLQVAKLELMRGGSAGATREFKTVDIGVPVAAYQDVQPAVLRRFPPLRRSAHKGQHGELLIIGGGAYPGALEFCARAAVRTGCDLVRAWTAGRSELPPTVIVHSQSDALVQPADPEELTPLLARASAVLIGPGLGREEIQCEAIQQAFSLAMEMGVPVCLDADALTALAETLRAMPEGDGRLLLTPHRGEARTLLGVPVTEAGIHAYARPDRVVLAKGPVDFLSDGWRWQRNPRGNPRMAVGGTGDVLAGLAAGLMARGATAFDAARMSALWICEAGDELWRESGPCYDTLDVIDRLPATLRRLLEPLGIWPPVVA
ncbi:bifunctional ADP-dependent NAD(P)H-hydrate dehydratase/NAD(P)H-hydrate epimerase [Planctomycetota bacterium]|nr:bifunctional ADP-dependent NAD(P)H-hydrate dehydratase/NAD(P)H-hydrate epimerase [Planctomycetota bacterium]